MASSPIIQADAECEPFHGDTIRHGKKYSGPGARIDRPLNSTSLNDTISKHDAMGGPVDFLIIYSKADDIDARELKKFLHVKFSCTSQLLSNSVVPTDALEENLDRTMFTLLYVTKSFSDCEWNRSIGNICHKRTLEENKKQWTVVPVYTKKKYQNRMPLTLRYLDGIEYWREDHDELGFSNLIDSKKDELSQHRQSTLKNTEQTKEKMVIPVAKSKITLPAGRDEEAKREDVKAIEERVQDIALSSVLHVHRPSASSSPLIAVEAENSIQNDVTVDCIPGTLNTSARGSVMFSDGGKGVSSHVKAGSDTTVNEQKQRAETKGSCKSKKYEMPGPEDSDSN